MILYHIFTYIIKGTTDASDSQQSGAAAKHIGNMNGPESRGVNGSTENLVPDSKTTAIKKAKKKKRKSVTHGIESGGDGEF